MTMINCSKTKYLEALSQCFHNERGTRDERARLREPTRKNGNALPLIEHGIFNYTENGRQIDISTWLMILRADMRGNLALSSLLKNEFETGTDGKRRKKKPSAENISAALARQKDIIMKALNECPSFFSGMLEDDVHELREEAAQ